MNVRMMKNKGKVEVIIKDIAYQKMMCYTNSVKTEIGWLGTATRDEGMFTIHDVFLLEQEVHGATAELTTEGISKLLYDELSIRKDYDFLLENMKVWGHSHNVMPVSPSSQDEKQMEMFEDGGYDFVIRLITNYHGEIGVTIYDYKTGFIYDEVKWSVKYSEFAEENMKSVSEKIEYYTLLLNSLKNTSLIDEEEIKREVKAKVREKKYNFNTFNTKKHKNYKDKSKKYDYESDERDFYDIMNEYEDESYYYDPYIGMEKYVDYDKALEEGAIDIDEEGRITWLV